MNEYYADARQMKKMALETGLLWCCMWVQWVRSENVVLCWQVNDLAATPTKELVGDVVVTGVGPP